MAKLTKLKIIIIALFLLINAILIGLYITDSRTSRTLRAEVLSTLSEFLIEKNITITADKFPVLPSSLIVYKTKNELSDKTSIADKILGPENYMLEPNHFQNKNQNLIINGGLLDFSPIKKDEDDLKKLGKPQAFPAKNKAKSTLKQSKLWTNKSKIIGTQNDYTSNQLILTVSDKLGKYYVLDSYAKIWVGTENTKDLADKTIVTRICGFNWLNTNYEKIPNSQKKILPLIEVLTKFVRERESTTPITITAIEFGYIVGERIPEIKEVSTDIGLKLITNDGIIYLSCLEH